MPTIPYEALTYSDAVLRYGLDGLPRPSLDVVRIVTTPVVREGDFCLDE